MKSPLVILHLEDDRNDASLVQSTLESADIPCAITRVENEKDFIAAIKHGGFDLILSDFSLPTFDGLSALKIARIMRPDLPVIVVSGTLGEELAIDSLKNGATDYVLKERLARLGPAVRRAMQEVKERAEHHNLQVQLIEAQKMEVIGKLASGVAHDFNNILSVIMFSSELIEVGLTPGHPLLQYTEEIRMASERAAGLTRQLLVSSRKQTVLPTVLDLNEVVESLETMLRRLIDKDIELTILPGENLGHLKADSGYLGQVLMNLVVNARDAMPNGGTLAIRTSNVTLMKSDIHPGMEIVAGDYVMLSVSDTGTGMSEDVKRRLFEVFFTTKPLGKGTGLGLASCQTIVQQSGGYIEVQSEVGEGSIFKIYFPRVDQEIDFAMRPLQMEPPAHGTETLLVVEDEPAVRHLACQVLETLGYEVVSASNGQEALHAAHEHRGTPIRLVITDVIMPLRNGNVMAEWLKATNPDLKILFTSGYTDETIAHHGVLDLGIEFLSKPYTPAILARKVRDLLDKTE